MRPVGFGNVVADVLGNVFVVVKSHTDTTTTTTTMADDGRPSTQLYSFPFDRRRRQSTLFSLHLFACFCFCDSLFYPLLFSIFCTLSLFALWYYFVVLLLCCCFNRHSYIGIRFPAVCLHDVSPALVQIAECHFDLPTSVCHGTDSSTIAYSRETRVNVSILGVCGTL